MRLAANARIIVQCFLERLPFVWEDHTVWLAPNKTVHSMGSIEGREGACGQAAAGVKGKASKPSWIADLKESYGVATIGPSRSCFQLKSKS